MAQITRELVKTLAAAQRLQIAEERLELVRREYENFMLLVEAIERTPLPPQTEPRTPPNPQ